jgi:hypothetical protein
MEAVEKKVVLSLLHDLHIHPRYIVAHQAFGAYHSFAVLMDPCESRFILTLRKEYTTIVIWWRFLDTECLESRA